MRATGVGRGYLKKINHGSKLVLNGTKIYFISFYFKKGRDYHGKPIQFF